MPAPASASASDCFGCTCSSNGSLEGSVAAGSRAAPLARRSGARGRQRRRLARIFGVRAVRQVRRPQRPSLESRRGLRAIPQAAYTGASVPLRRLRVARLAACRSSAHAARRDRRNRSALRHSTRRSRCSSSRPERVDDGTSAERAPRDARRRGNARSILAWGALAFGAVYSWAFWPLAVACRGWAARHALTPRAVTCRACRVALRGSSCLRGRCAATLVQWCLFPSNASRRCHRTPADVLSRARSSRSRRGPWIVTRCRLRRRRR